mmetsp:Transcript_27013/g.44597  ORF Transcript_27013/g.44597 Transcript_27013/m.44597 type:complete len:233 (+) Transcript_27013:263-961(+)
MVVSNLPFSIFIHINKRISSLHLVSSSSHGEFVGTNILAPVGTTSHITIHNLPLGLFLQKVHKVGSDGTVICTRSVRNSWKENTFFGISLGNLIRVKSGKSIVPQVKQASNLIIANLQSSRSFRHLGRMVMSNLPLAIFININKAVSGLDLVTSSSHGELIDTNILAPIITCRHITLQDYSLWLELQKVDKVVLDRSIISTRSVRNSWKENTFFGISLGNLIRVKSCKSIVP